MFWALALISLGLTATPAVTTTKQPATKGKAAPANNKTAAKNSPTKSATKAATKPAYSRYNTTSTRRTAPTRQRVAYHPAPMAPTPERTKEIQSALAQKGYLSGEPSGAWDPDTQAAMKRFQKDQNLDADGKIGALSLIALGLGPKRSLTSTPSTTNFVPAPPKP